MTDRNYKARVDTFSSLLNYYTSLHPEFDTDQWRSYFKSLAYRESDFKANTSNKIKAYGYFQLMPANQKRSKNNPNPGAQFEDVFDLTRANLSYLRQNMTDEDRAKAQAMGIDIYGLAAGAHLGGAQGMLNYIRSGKNPQDYNGTKISYYARDFSQNPKIKTNTQLGNWSVEGQAVRFEDVANGTSVLTGDTPQAPLLAVISNMNNALSDENAVVYQQPDATEESLNVWRSRIPKDIVIEETQPTQEASKTQDNNKNTQQQETQFKSLVRYGVPEQRTQEVPVQYVEDPLKDVQNVWDTYNTIYDELFSRDTFKERERALGGPINTNNPIQNFSYFKGQLPVVRYSYGGKLYDSVIPSSNSVNPNLFYDGGDTMTSQFLDQVLADREADQLRKEELAAQYNFSPQAISDIQQGKDVNVYTPDVVVTGKAPSVGFYPYGYHTVDKFYQDNPSGLMKDVGSFVPFVGDSMEIGNIGQDLYKGNYNQAVVGLGLMALPNILEKPMKYVGRKLHNLYNTFQNVKTTPQITLKNAVNITPEQWTAAQDTAIARGDMREAQRLRDLHFMIAFPNNKAINSKGTPLLSYHTVGDKYNPNFTAFNPEIEGTHSSIYTTDNPFMSGSYTTKITSELERNNIIEVTRQRELNKYNKLLEDAQNRKATNAYEKSKKEDDIKFANKWLKIYSDPKKGKKQILRDHPWVSMPTENERMKRLYINLENPIVIDNYGRGWHNMPLHQLPEDVYNLITPDIRGNLLNAYYTTRSLEKAQRAANRYDGSIIKNVVDYGGQKQYGFEEPGTVFQINNSNNIKLEDAVTYDDKGVRIPLGERDNFNINDIRYGLVLPVATGLGLSLYNQDNQRYHSLGGPLNKFEEGGHTISAPFLNRPANKFLLGGPGDTSILGRYFDSAIEQVKNAGRAVKALLSDDDNTKHTKKQHKSDDSKKEYTWLQSLGNKIATKTGLDFLYTDSPNKNMQAIIDHMVTNGNNNNYGIIDKKNQKLYIMNGNDTLRAEEITLGKNVGDGYNILAPSKKVYYRNLPRTTGAGIYNVKVRGHQPGYNNEQMLDLYENKVRSGIALHAPTKDPTRRAAFNNNNQEDNRVSYGCVSGNCGIVQDIINKRQLSESTPLFILPEMEDNYIRENNGVLETIWVDTPETYTNDSGTFKYRYNKQKYKSPTSKLSEGGLLNKFEEGGNTDDTKYQAFIKDLKKYAPNLAAPSEDYNMRRYWELRGKPSNWEEAQRDFNYLYNVKEDPMFTLENDGAYHAHSTAFNQDTGIYEFMKSADHPTVKYELNWYDNGDETGPNGLRIPSFEGFKSSQDFKQNYELKYSPIENKYYYVPRANKKVEGGGLKEVVSDVGTFLAHPTDSELINLGLSYMPFVGSAMDIGAAIENPTWGNAGTALASVGLDLLGGSLIKGAYKTYKHAKKVKQLEDALNLSSKKAAQLSNLKKKSSKVSHKKMNSLAERRAEVTNIQNELKRMQDNANFRDWQIYWNNQPVDLTPVINAKTVYGTDAFLNTLNQYRQYNE